MDIHPQILIFGGSLIAIFLLAGLSALLRLGSKPVLRGRNDAMRAAGEVHDGFQPADLAISKSGDAAILKDKIGQVMVIRQHGNQFAGRILTPASSATSSDGQLLVTTGERRYGNVTLIVDNAASWAEAINRLDDVDHA